MSYVYSIHCYGGRYWACCWFITSFTILSNAWHQNIFSNVTKEYKDVYDNFMKDDDVYYISEHRQSYHNNKDLDDIVFDNPDFVILPISITRFTAVEVSKK